MNSSRTLSLLGLIPAAVAASRWPDLAVGASVAVGALAVAATSTQRSRWRRGARDLLAHAPDPAVHPAFVPGLHATAGGPASIIEIPAHDLVIGDVLWSTDQDLDDLTPAHVIELAIRELRTSGDELWAEVACGPIWFHAPQPVTVIRAARWCRRGHCSCTATAVRVDAA